MSFSAGTLATITHTEALALLVSHSTHHIAGIAHLVRQPHLLQNLLVLLTSRASKRTSGDLQGERSLQRVGLVQEDKNAVASHTEEVARDDRQIDDRLVVVEERDALAGIGNLHIVVEDELHTAVGRESGVMSKIVEENERRSSIEHDRHLEEELITSTIGERDLGISLLVR